MPAVGRVESSSYGATRVLWCGAPAMARVGSPLGTVHEQRAYLPRRARQLLYDGLPYRAPQSSGASPRPAPREGWAGARHGRAGVGRARLHYRAIVDLFPTAIEAVCSAKRWCGTTRSGISTAGDRLWRGVIPNGPRVGVARTAPGRPASQWGWGGAVR